MSPRLRKLQILIVDNEDATADGVLNQSLGSRGYDKEYALSYEEAVENLELRAGLAEGRKYLPYDLILFDLHLGDKLEYGGTKLLAEYWKVLQESGTRALLYSGKTDAFVEPYLPFQIPDGPFLFTRKIPETVWAEKILLLLRARVNELCSRAPLGSARNILDGGSKGVRIDGEDWSVESLLAPWLSPAVETGRKQKREALIRMLFPENDMIRIFSYWFKARTFLWDSEQMFGLSPLALYHCGAKTGPMDALLHTPEFPNNVMFGVASKAARSDLDMLRAGLNSEFVRDIDAYLNQSQVWRAADQMDEAAAVALKEKVKFTLSDVSDIFKRTLGEGVHKFSNFESFSDIEFYCPAHYGAGSAEPAILYALKRLWQSVVKHSGVKSGGECEVLFGVEGSLTRDRASGAATPYFIITIRHNGPACEGPSLASWFPERHRGHGLFDAKEALRGLAQWTVLSRGEGKPKYYSPLQPNSVVEEEALKLWNTYNADDQWNVIHVLRFGFPAIEA